MKMKFKCGDKAEASVTLAKSMRSGAKLGGVFEIDCYRPDGSLAWHERAENIMTDEGLNRNLNVFWHGTTQTSPWYMGLVETDTVPAAGMTYDTPVFTECTAYDETTRPAYNEALSTAKSTTNSANKAAFTMNATKTIYGAFLASVSTKGDHTAGADNVLACYARFSASQAVQDDYVLSATYTSSAADDGV
jgi:hypothetical protein